MPSVLGLLEERERAARQRVEVLEGELREAEAVWERFVIARETVAAVLQEPDGGEGIAPTAAAPAGDGPVRNAASVPGSVVPHWNDGLAPTVLAPDYQRIMDVVAGGRRPGAGAMDCRQLAVALGLETVPAKVEGVRSKAKRLAARGWLAEYRPGMFSLPAGRGGGS
ncbi:hypothetical protein [Streptomyces sp. NBC_01579]|uniref:hypothetical protein n=1 Tax=Streptomyces sp. NBC_01579 TaxID=2975885 RepID=UPI00386C03CE